MMRRRTIATHGCDLQRKITAIEILLRHMQVPRDGQFCRNDIRAAVTALIDDIDHLDVPTLIWAQLAPHVPDCTHPNCC
jgi:hypothetical protein